MLDFLHRPATVRLRPKAKRLNRHTSLVLDGRRYGVAIHENARTRRMTLRLLQQSKGDDAFKVTVPPGTALDEIDAFLARNADWAREQIGARPAAVVIEDGAVIPVRGCPTRIVHIAAGRGTTRLGATADGEAALFVHGEAAHVSRRVKDFLKREARRDLTAAVGRYATTLGVKPSSITIRDTVSRWGSCSTTGALNFSWRIVLAPPEVLDYLAAHEVAHLREMNHSDRFWAHVRDVMPDMEDHRRWLRAHGATLHAVS